MGGLFVKQLEKLVGTGCRWIRWEGDDSFYWACTAGGKTKVSEGGLQAREHA